MDAKSWNSVLAEVVVLFFAIACAQPNSHHWRYGGNRSNEWAPNGSRRDTYPYPNYRKPPSWYGQPARDTCPCVKKKATGECVTYDPRFQAASIEEAIVNFPDLQINSVSKQAGQASPRTTTGQSPAGTSGTTPQTLSLPASVVAFAKKGTVPGIQNSPVAQPAANASTVLPPSPSSGLCGTDRECQDCSSALLNRLSNTGILEGTELDQVSKRLGLEQLPQRRGCEKYRFGKSSIAAYSRVAAPTSNATATLVDPLLDNLVKQLQEKGEQNWRKKQAQSSRTTRQASSKPGTTLGQQFKIDCSKRGEPVEQGSTWVGLCNVCWAWRKLPSSYFPQYVNELICDKDTKCMSGWGSCQQRYKSVDILQNTGTDANPTWKQVTISVANYCDCEVESGSSMHNFVAA